MNINKRAQLRNLTNLELNALLKASNYSDNDLLSEYNNRKTDGRLSLDILQSMSCRFKRRIEEYEKRKAKKWLGFLSSMKEKAGTLVNNRG